MTLVLLAVALVPLLSFALISYNQFQYTLENTALREVVVLNQYEVQNLKNYLFQFETDILSLSHLPVVAALIEARSLEPKDVKAETILAQKLAETLAAFAERKKFYQKLRYIDETGHERVRVEFRADEQKILIVPPDELQDKQARYYFTMTAQLSSNQVYVSDIDLSQENNQIEEPHVPVLRYATPLFNQKGEFRGIIISNIYVNDFLHQLSNHQLNGNVEAYLANQAGYYLHHPDPRYEFGFDLGTDFSMVKDFAWIMSQAKGRDVVAAIDPQTHRVMAVQKIYFDTHKPERYWFLAKTISGDNVLNDVNILSNTILSLITIVVVVAVLLAIWLAGTIIQPLQILAEATAKIAQGNLHVPINITTHDEVGQLAQNFGLMTRQIQALIDNLEERIQVRTQALEMSAEISRKIVTILDLDELLQYVVERIESGFRVDHAFIYFVSENKEELIFVGGTGEIGRSLKAAGHRLAVGQGIVGQVARSGQLFLAADVTSLPFFQPLLPETKSELALPLRKGEVIIGVLDIHSERLAGFQEGDLTSLQSIADQIAVAVDNARLFKDTQMALAAVEALNRRLTRASWQSIEQKTAAAGYMFTKQAVKPLTRHGQEWLSPMTTAVRQRELIQGVADERCIAVPLVLRDEVIGVIGLERQTAAWTEDEIIVVQTLTEQIALALDAARLARETQRRAAREEIIANMTQTVWSANSIEEILRNSVKQLGQTFKATKVVLRLGSEQKLKHEALEEKTSHDEAIE